LQQRSGVRLKPSMLRPEITGDVERLVLQALNYNPKDRPQSARSFGDELSSALTAAEMTRVTFRPVSPPRAKWWIGAEAVLVLLTVGGIAAYIMRPSAPRITAQQQSPPAEAPKTTAAPKADDEQVELAFWNSVSTSTDPRFYREYLAKYPQGRFADLAKIKLDALAKPAAKSETAQKSPPTPPEPATPDVSEALKNLPKMPELAKITEMAKSLANMGNKAPGIGPLRSAIRLDDYSGPLRGELIWGGKLDPGESFTIQGGRASGGRLIGDLPRVPVTMDIMASGGVITEPPSATNQWDRVVFKNDTTRVIGGVVLHWRVAK